ncbi:MAG: peptidoglycan-binding protein [Acidobacteriaceae bacterium]|nr:peptidoglycan-binding protein [Acidobacteriaceae bacterium]
MKWVFFLLLGASALLFSAPARTKATSSATSAHTAHGHSRRTDHRAKAAPAPSYQLHPDPARYQEIQQALADRGYFKGQVNGQWADDSVDALKRFQADQKLDPDGKINALSLTGLGLGPKHNGAATKPDTAAAPQPAAVPQ